MLNTNYIAASLYGAKFSFQVAVDTSLDMPGRSVI